MPALLGGTGIIGKDIFVKMKAQKSASIQTASGTVVTFPQSAERAFSGLNVYGHSTQSGTPSPDNPVPIVSAGSVMTTGAQLFDIKKATSRSSAYGLTISIDGENIKISGIVSDIPDNSSVAFRILNYPENLYGNKFSMDIVDSTGTQGSYVYGSESENVLAINFNTSLGAEVNLVFRLMVNSGSVALPWEPYTGGVPGVNPYEGEINISVSDGGTQSQTLTLSTPGGLPGIPVDSGGNYTDESDQQWVCDEIDLKRGKYIQRVGSVLADGTVNKFTASADNVFWNLNADHTAPGVISGQWYLSIYFSKYFFNANEPGEFIYVTSEKGQEYFDTIEDLNAFCVEKNAEGNPLIIYYPMDPIETDLPAEEIAAYKALHTYSPNTTVSNDAEAWMKVGYNEFSKQTF